MLVKNWKKIAEGWDLRIPDADLERIAAPLDSLESSFRPLAKDIPDDAQPAVTFGIQPESGE